MSARGPIEYRDASPTVRAVFDDIMHTRQVEDVNNFWKYLAHDPPTLKRTWDSVKEIMAAGALDAVTKEMVYLAVFVRVFIGNRFVGHGALFFACVLHDNPGRDVRVPRKFRMHCGCRIDIRALSRRAENSREFVRRSAMGSCVSIFAYRGCRRPARCHKQARVACACTNCRTDAGRSAASSTAWRKSNLAAVRCRAIVSSPIFPTAACGFTSRDLRFPSGSCCSFRATASARRNGRIG